MPETPLELPLSVNIDVNEGLFILCQRNGTFLPDIEQTLVFTKEDICEVLIYLMPDSSNDDDRKWNSESDLSIAIVRHIDHFHVVPYFQSVFTTPKSYYFRALEKGLRNLGVKVHLVEENTVSRKQRYLKESTASSFLS